ncbi:hypothetical protein Dimus_022408 [Dionaea muscipula]
MCCFNNFSWQYVAGIKNKLIYSRVFKCEKQTTPIYCRYELCHRQEREEMVTFAKVDLSLTLFKIIAPTIFGTMRCWSGELLSRKEGKQTIRSAAGQCKYIT